MTTLVTQDRVILYVQPDGAGTAMKPLSLDKNGMADKTHPGTGRSVVWGRDAFGNYIPKLTTLDPPGGLNTSTVEEDDVGTFSFLAKMFARVGCFPVQERWYKCGRLDGPTWTRIKQFGLMTVTQKVDGAGPSREASGAGMFNTYEVSWPYTVELYQHALTNLTIAEDQDLNAIAVLSDLVVGCSNCFPGYQPDEIIYVAGEANAGSPGDNANIWYSINAGGAFAITSADPFGAGVSVEFLLVAFVSDTQYRLIAISDAVTAQIKYADVTLGDEGTTTWSAAITVGTAAVEAAAWLFYDRLYAATAGDIYVSTDQGETFGAALYTGTAALAAFARSPIDDSVWAVGATNTILHEVGQSGTFDALTGPAGGGNFTAVTVANDGTIYVGNGTSLYKNTNNALNAGGWTLLRDFGAAHVVEAINCAGGTKSQGGDSQLIRVVVDDTTPGDGEVWESVDGGNSFTQVTELDNTGYNAAFFSPNDNNLAIIVGDGGEIQKLTAKAI